MKTCLLFSAISATVGLNAQTVNYADKILDFQQMHKGGLITELHIDTSKVQFYSINKELLVTAKVEILQNEPVFKMITSSGKTKDAVKYAKVTFSYRSKPYNLYAYQLIALKTSKDNADHFFIPFKDAGTDKESYHGGRYIDFVTADIKNGSLELDFNKAYNPNCAFVDGYNCPIPPAENRLGFNVKAGEKKFSGH